MVDGLRPVERGSNVRTVDFTYSRPYKFSFR